MATIRKFRGKFNVQIRRQGYPSVSRTFTSLATAKRWGSTTEADMERNLHVVLPDKTTTRELLDRYEEDWFYPDSPDTSLRVDNPHLEVKNAKKTIYSRI